MAQTGNLIAFLLLFLYRYIRLVVNTWAYHRLRPIKPSRAANITPQDVTIVIPSLDGCGKELLNTMASILANVPAMVILVTIDKNREKAEKFLEGVSPGQTKLRVESVRNPSKRRQMAKAIEYVNTKIVVFVDDDVIWPSPNLLRWVVAPFEKSEKMGGLATCQYVRQDTAQTFSGYLWRFLGAIYLERRNFDCSATTYIDGGTPCISGRTSAYRTSILQDPRFLQGLCNETWQGMQIRPDDDNFLTRWMVSNGWDTYFQFHPEAAVLTTLENNGKFLIQCVRWSRSNWRSNLRSMFVEWVARRRHPYSTYAVFLTTLSPPAIVGDAALVWLCRKATEDLENRQTLLRLLLLWMFVSKFIKFLGYFRRRPWDILLLPVSILFGYAHGAIKLYAGATLQVVSWGSREGADEAE